MNDTWQTAITKVEPNKILIHGYRLDELMGRITYAQMLYLLLKGELPSEGMGNILDAILVSSIDHGVTPPSTLAAITATSTGAPVNAALATGILSINKFHGGAIEGCMEMLENAEKYRKEKGISTEEAAKEIVNQYQEKKQRLPGFGHRIHTNDPRTRRLYELASHYHIDGNYVNMMKALEKEIEKTLNKRFPINVDGAIASLLCELGFDPQLGNAFFIIARIPGLLAHIKEEKERYKPMRRINPTAHSYDGHPEREYERGNL